MKKTLFLCLALCLAMLGGCSSAGDEAPTNPGTATNTPAATAPAPTDTASETEESEAAAPDPNAGPMELFFGSKITDMEGDWRLSQVYAGGETFDAVENAANLEISLELEPSELVDEVVYIHNQVYNMTGILNFGLDTITQTLAADDVDSYKGTTSWRDFLQGEMVEDGGLYKQPGPATMRFKDIDNYGLFLDQLATGAPAEMDTTERTLIIGLNNRGQLLLGASEEHLERLGEEGDWTYCLIFDKAA